MITDAGTIHRSAAWRSKVATNTYGGGIDHRTVIGHAPESREWRPGDITFRPFIARSARIEAYVTIDAGLKHPTEIGARSWIMKGSHCGHDSTIGEDCELAPHCVVGGHVEIGDRVRVGIGAMFKPFVKVGDGARIGMGAVVITDVPAGEVWAGNPARLVRSDAPHPDSIPKLPQSIFNRDV